MPQSLVTLTLISLAAAVICSIWIAWDCFHHPQRMGVMNLVWPVCALFGGVGVLWFYRRHGRAERHQRDQQVSFPVAVTKGALHCGAGCTLGDIVAETLAAKDPAILHYFGWPSLFAERMFAVWMVDFLFAFAIGIAFQYFAIAPMRDVRLGEGIWLAIKADTLSLVSWQVGMYGVMYLAVFELYRPLLGGEPTATSPVFWLTMQLAMLGGLATAYPVNWWLIRRGIKERM